MHRDRLGRYEDAVADCRTFRPGGHVVSMQSFTEVAAVKALYQLSTSGFIGLTRRAVDDEWVWADGRLLADAIAEARNVATVGDTIADVFSALPSDLLGHARKMVGNAFGPQPGVLLNQLAGLLRDNGLNRSARVLDLSGDLVDDPSKARGKSNDVIDEVATRRSLIAHRQHRRLLFNDLWDGLQDLGEDLVDGIGDAFTKVGDFYEMVVDGVKRKFNQAGECHTSACLLCPGWPAHLPPSTLPDLCSIRLLPCARSTCR